ncbi:hypothetical protein TNCV_2231061 [Trichonephila clavipes]|nr:hypothetical protein TNCV_2231061 [Trichonephila clavipes]
MAEYSGDLSEEPFSYFCLLCLSKYKEIEKQITHVYSRKTCFHCTECRGTFYWGVKKPKINSTDSPPYNCEEEFSYFCFPCRNETEETENSFLYVGALDACYTCTRYGETFDAAFNREKMKSRKRLPHRSEEEMCYFCFRRKNTTKETEKCFLFVSAWNRATNAFGVETHLKLNSRGRK